MNSASGQRQVADSAQSEPPLHPVCISRRSSASRTMHIHPIHHRLRQSKCQRTRHSTPQKSTSAQTSTVSCCQPTCAKRRIHRIMRSLKRPVGARDVASQCVARSGRHA